MRLSLLKSRLTFRCSCKGCKRLGVYKVSIYPENRKELTMDMNLCESHAIEAIYTDGAFEEVRLF